MPRPKRAAAVRAAANFVSTDKENHAPSHSPDSTPIRGLRRATFRSTRHGSRDLMRRRTDFERLVKFHQRHLHEISLSQPSHSSLTDDPAELAQVDVTLTPEWLQSIAEHPPDSLRVRLQALLLSLQATANMAETDHHVSLSGSPQRHPSEHDDIHAVTDALVTERFLSHQADNVKLLVACCLAELLRICAPDPPITERKLNDVCALFIEQLAILAVPNDAAERFRFSLLEQLATVKTFVIFCDDPDVICDLFACFYAAVRPHQSDKINQYFADILVSLLEEAEKIEFAALDSLLAPLVPAYHYTEGAVLLATRVLEQASSFIQVPMSSLLNASLRDLHLSRGNTILRKLGHPRKSPSKKKPGSSLGVDTKDHSEHHEHIEELIVSINQALPDVLVYVIPNLEDGLISKDDSKRLASSTLLSRLFTSRADIAESYPSLFAEFLNRARDESSDVRETVTAALARLLRLHPKHREHIRELLQNRIFDRSESVRAAAVRSVGKAGGQITDDLLKLQATRLRDKKQSIRDITASAIKELYIGRPQEKQSGSLQHGLLEDTPHDDRDMEEGKDDSDDAEQSSVERRFEDDLESRTGRFTWLPDTLIESIVAVDAVGDTSTARYLENVILEDIPALSSKKQGRAKSGLRQLSIFLSHLSEAGYMTLSSRVRDKWKARGKLLSIIQERMRSRKGSQVAHKETPEKPPSSPSGAEPPALKPVQEEAAGTDESEEIREKLTAGLAACIGRRCSGPHNVLDMCKLITTIADYKCLESIEKAVHCGVSHEEYVSHRQDALRRSKLAPPASSFWKDIIIADCYPGVFSSRYFSIATDIAIEESEKLEGDRSAEDATLSSRVLHGVLRFIDLFGTQASPVLEHVIKDIRSLCFHSLNRSCARSEVLMRGLRLIQCLDPTDKAWADEDMKERLNSLMVPNELVSPRHAARLSKLASCSMVRIYAADAAGVERLSELAKELATNMDCFDGDVKSIVPPLAALGQIAKRSPEAFKSVALGCFDFSRVLLSGSLNAKLESFDREAQHTVEKESWTDDESSLFEPMFGPYTEQLCKELRNCKDLWKACLVQQAMKLLVYSLVHLEDDELSDVLKLLLKTAFEKEGRILESTSHVRAKSEVGDIEENGNTESSFNALCAAGRLFAGRAILYLSRSPKFFRGVSPSILCSTVLLLQDENSSVRLSMATTICNSVIKKRLPLRWIVGLALMAMDPDRKNVAHVKTLLSSAFRYRRRVYEQAKRESKSKSVLLLPEVTVPELIWVLSNLPDVELDEANGFQESEKCIHMFLDRLLESNQHAGILHDYIESLSIAQDATEEEDTAPGARSQRMNKLCEIAAAILKRKQAGKKWNLSQYCGQVSLPKDMFRLVGRNVDTSSAKPVSLVQVARRFDEKTRTHSAGKLRKDIGAASASVATQGKSTSSGKKRQRTGVCSATGGETASSRQEAWSPTPPQSSCVGEVSRQTRGRKRQSSERNEDSEGAVDETPTTGAATDGHKKARPTSKERGSDSPEASVATSSKEATPSPSAAQVEREQTRKRSRRNIVEQSSSAIEAKEERPRRRRSARNRGM